MFKVVTLWNLVRPDEELGLTVRDIELRGYNPDVFLTGEFAMKLSQGEVRPLSVSDVADRHCPVRRDLYLRKGVNRLEGAQARGRSTWGRAAGNVVEAYMKALFARCDERNDRAYSRLRRKGTRVCDDFASSSRGGLDTLRALEEGAEGPESGDTDWLLRLLLSNGTAELGSKLLHGVLNQHGCVDCSDLRLSYVISPTPERIGLSPQVTPDFILPDHRIVGDIKTGVEFKEFYLLTCAGYALAFENELGAGHDIDWGIVYFFPTRNPSAYVRPLTFAQVYIFPIDDSVRRWFMNSRDEAYALVSRTQAPAIPAADKRDHCPHCAFLDYCANEGLHLAT